MPSHTIYLLNTFSAHSDTVLGAYLWQMVRAKMEITYGKDANNDYARGKEADCRDTGQACRKGGFP